MKKILLLTLLMACVATLASCAGNSIPATRVDAMEALAKSSFFLERTVNNYSAERINETNDERLGFSSNIIANEIKAPVAIIFEQKMSEWYFAKTDIFDTVQNLSDANSVLYVRIADFQEKGYLRYEVHFSDAHFDSAYEAYTDNGEVPKEIVFKIPVTGKKIDLEQADNQFFLELATCLSITQGDAASISDMIHLLRDSQVEQPQVVDAVARYTYPEKEKLSNSPAALRKYKAYLYKELRNIPPNDDPDEYAREADLFEKTPPLFLAGNKNAAAWVDALQGDAYLIVYFERIGAKRYKGYQGNIASAGKGLYAYIYRATIVDSNTEQIIAWEEGSLEGDPPSTVYDFEFSKQGGRNVYKKGMTPPDFLSVHMAK